MNVVYCDIICRIMQHKTKGRGSTINPTGRFEKMTYQDFFSEGENLEQVLKTEFINTHPKTILNKVDSPDIPFFYSSNPYQGCEHGCIYCYARPTHNYWGYSSGVDFEQKILIKHNAPLLLRKAITRKNWIATPIALSGNTDCYQPAEAKYKITRRMLEVLYEFRHPVSIITKNALILRDLDILKKLNEHNLVSVAISLTTMDQKLQSIMEPRTSTPKNRLKIIKTLSESNIPVVLMMAPVIPGLTDHEILKIAKWGADNGARNISYTIIRLNQDIDQLFESWLTIQMPDRKDKIMNAINEIRSHKSGNREPSSRMKGSGVLAQMINDQIQLARKKYFPNTNPIELNTSLHEIYKDGQLKLF